MKRALWKLFKGLIVLAACVYVAALIALYFGQRHLLYLPTHWAPETALSPWRVDGRQIGFKREVSNPANLWLMMHGNGGQADRATFVIRHLSDHDSVYVLEYPGFGERGGETSAESINAAAVEAFESLRRAHPGKPVCVIGESLGSGPASYLASRSDPPDRVVLMVPFDNLASVAGEKYPIFPVRLMLRDNWDNIRALASYRGKLEIFGALHDQVVPFHHAKNLAAHFPAAAFHVFDGTHDWAATGSIEIRN